ncbi:MAG: recombinase family protein [Alphaproteobacteria bacterium]|nr:recombinase family protein [Alphaproteobacteria bacterium]
MSTLKKPRALRCAIYTRKSTEEGLDQAFNSLHAQREACEAYVKSQAGEGWSLSRTIYDDGGYSGGSMERPALASLLADIEKGQVDIVVVYKVDRLTRSLTDFAKIVEQFDKRGVSFVSVTQAFNTTNSMGRLTLNVLLSFAQFEREVASERIRDKIGASRRKGMWMGGSVPVGYDVKDRKLVPNPVEVRQVRHFFERYTQLKSINELRLELKAQSVKSVVKTSVNGTKRGGLHFSRGALTHLLRNRVYVGEVPFKGAIYAGEHEGIVERSLFDQAQAILDENRRLHIDRPKTRLVFPLIGLIFDDQGHPMTPLHSQKGRHKRYRYYVSRALIDKDRGPAGSIPRVPAHAVEEIVVGVMGKVLARDGGGGVSAAHDPEQLRAALQRVELGSKSIVLRLDPSCLNADDPSYAISGLAQRLGGGSVVELDRDHVAVNIPVQIQVRRGMHQIAMLGAEPVNSFAQPDAAVVKAIVRAHAWLKVILDGEVDSIYSLSRMSQCDHGYVRRVLKLAFLSPAKTEALLEGASPTPRLEDIVAAAQSTSWAKCLY